MPAPTIGFCTTCRNRLWQLEQTLPENLATIGDRNTLTLIDYGSTDGLADWVWSRYREEIGKRLHFFEVTNEVRWNVSKAKNLAHRLSPGEYLFNLDGDNFVALADLERISAAAAESAVCSQFSGDNTDGSFGRIGITRKLFIGLGGYDEAMLPMGVQDRDLLARCTKAGFPPRMLGAPGRMAVMNNTEQKMAEVGKSGVTAHDLHQQMLALNTHVGKWKLQHEGPVRRGGFASYNGRLNGKPVTIDGFNRIWPREDR